MTIAVKICGVTRPEIADMAVGAGASHIGLVFYPRSPRFVTDAIAREIAQDTPRPAKRVGLFVDPTNDDLDTTLSMVPLDMLQLHGTETPERLHEIKRLYRLPVMKALRIGCAADLNAAHEYESEADWLLFDGKPPAGADRPGGNGVAFEWQLLNGHSWKRPWMLSGGLDPHNIRAAMTTSGATAVDVSSGVEIRPGMKDTALIASFIAAATMAS